jgi:hypothetical protein
MTGLEQGGVGGAARVHRGALLADEAVAQRAVWEQAVGVDEWGELTRTSQSRACTCCYDTDLRQCRRLHSP